MATQFYAIQRMTHDEWENIGPVRGHRTEAMADAYRRKQEDPGTALGIARGSGDDWQVEELNLGVCQWFLGCKGPVTHTTEHPILGPVPTCASH